jgi:hypothetical protein
VKDLFEARHYDDHPKAIQRMSELQELFEEALTEKNRQLDPPWPRFAHLVQHCRALATEAAHATRRSRDELLEYVRAQERLAERAFHERNQSLYRDCWGNLERYYYQLQDLCRAANPADEEDEEEASLTPEENARVELEQFRNYLSEVWKQARQRGRADLDTRLSFIARQGQGLSQRIKDDPQSALRTIAHWMKELAKIEMLAREGRGLDDRDTTTGLLEGML